MAKKLKFKPTPAGIMFLSAIGVLLVAIIIITIVLAKNCSKKSQSGETEPSVQPIESIEPSNEPTKEASLDTPDPFDTPDPLTTPDPNDTPDPNATVDPSNTSGPSAITITTPDTSAGVSASPDASASASPSPSYYTTPTSHMKNHSQKGYVSKDSVNMRKEPNTNAKVVTSKIAKNTAVTLYVEQEGWWFLKCGDKYGYIRSDMITKGTPPEAASDGSATGKVAVSNDSVIALRKGPGTSYKCTKEYKNGTEVTIYHSEKDKSGKKWYYVKTPDGNKGYMFASYVKVTKGKVPAK
jgi:uncharacterized protein YgiM (DUF1202 family)